MADITLSKTESKNDVTQAEGTRGAYYTPRVDILETTEELLLYADMPGVRPADVDVRFENGELILHGRCQERQPQQDFSVYEYGVGDFYRAFNISHDIDADKIAAELKKGVLTVHLPKSERVKPRRISVQGE
jgi:HSP20 family protein